MQLGHRASEDIDLFSNGPTRLDGPIKALMLDKYQMNSGQGLSERLMAAQQPDWNKLAIQGFIGEVKIDLLDYHYPQLKPAELYPGTAIRIASLEDIGAMKLIAVSNSGNRLKDFVDVAALSEKITLRQMLTAYEQRYQAPSNHALRALSYHGDIDHSIKLQMPEYSWKAVAQRLEQMQRNPDKLFPPLVQRRIPPPQLTLGQPAAGQAQRQASSSQKPEAPQHKPPTPSLPKRRGPRL